MPHPYRTSTGAILFPLDKPPPAALARRRVNWRVRTIRNAALAALVAIAVAHPVCAQTAASWVATGRALLDSGRHDAAVKALEKAVALDGQSSRNRLLLAEALGAVVEKANVLRQPFLARRIKSELETARDLDPRGIDPHQGLLQYYLRAPAIAGGGVSKARGEAAEIAKINPLRGRFAYAQIARHERDSAGIERAYRTALAENPDSVPVYVSLAGYLFNTRRADDAFSTIDALLARRPNEPVGIYYIGLFASVSGRQLDRGEAMLRQFLALPADISDRGRPPAAMAHFRLGELLAKQGDTPGARRELETALRLNPRLNAARAALASLR